MSEFYKLVEGAVEFRVPSCETPSVLERRLGRAAVIPRPPQVGLKSVIFREQCRAWISSHGSRRGREPYWDSARLGVFLASLALLVLLLGSWPEKGHDSQEERHASEQRQRQPHGESEGTQSHSAVSHRRVPRTTSSRGSVR